MYMQNYEVRGYGKRINKFSNVITSTKSTMNFISDFQRYRTDNQRIYRKDFPQMKVISVYKLEEIAIVRVVQRSKALQHSQIVTKIKQINSDFSLDCLLFRGTIQKRSFDRVHRSYINSHASIERACEKAIKWPKHNDEDKNPAESFEESKENALSSVNYE